MHSLILEQKMICQLTCVPDVEFYRSTEHPQPLSIISRDLDFVISVHLHVVYEEAVGGVVDRPVHVGQQGGRPAPSRHGPRGVGEGGGGVVHLIAHRIAVPGV